VQTAIAVLAQAFAVALALVLGRALSMARPAEPARFAAAAAAILFTWSFGHAAIRWLYHLGAMDDGAPFIGLEGFAHALWPLVLALAGAAITAQAPGRDTVRAYLFDLQAIWGAAIWPALAYAALGLWLFFNPWWGFNPAVAATPFSASAGLAALLLAAWLSALSPSVPHVRWPNWLARSATIACIAHLFVAAILTVRWLHHGAEMRAGAVGSVEMWTYSAVSAVFGAGVFGLGLRRGDAMLRWIGLAVLLATTAKVFVLDTERLGGFIRALSAIGLAVVLFVVAWIARTYRPAPPPGPGDLLTIKPSARRERRHGRRQRSS
jgi:uncharacterized membrane protein